MSDQNSRALNRTGSPISTATGRQFWPLDPRPEHVAVRDIAGALSRLCRFGGHCRSFYSVAQHSVHVAELVAEQVPEAALWALLHDAAEAYLLDLPRPIKYASGMEPYREAEARVKAAIASAFCLSATMPAVVRWADQTIFATEVRDLMTNGSGEIWSLEQRPLPQRIEPWEPRHAEARFLEMFQRLMPASGRADIGESAPIAEPPRSASGERGGIA